MTVAVGVLAALNVALLIWALWMISRVRDDQMIIRTFIAAELRAGRAFKGAPVDDEGFLKWLQENADRPYRDDPPLGRPK